MVELSHSSAERLGEAVNVRSFLAVSRPGSYRIEAALQAMGGAIDTVPENERPRGLAPDAVEWARGVTEPYPFSPVGPAIELGPEDSGILALRWRIGIPRSVAIVRVREADPGRHLKEVRIPVG